MIRSLMKISSGAKKERSPRFLHNWQTSTADDHNGDYAFQFINGGASRDQGGRGGGGGVKETEEDIQGLQCSA